MSAKIRKHQTTLICSGLAVIAFGIWSIVRALLVFWFNMTRVRSVVSEQMPAEGLDLSPETIITISVIVVFVFLILDLFFRFYVGLSALSEGRGKYKRSTYIVLSVLFLVLSACGQVALFVSSAREELTVKIFVTLIIEFSSNIAFVEIIRSAAAIRWYARKANTDRGETSYAA